MCADSKLGSTAERCPPEKQCSKLASGRVPPLWLEVEKLSNSQKEEKQRWLELGGYRHLAPYVIMIQQPISTGGLVNHGRVVVDCLQYC